MFPITQERSARMRSSRKGNCCLRNPLAREDCASAILFIFDFDYHGKGAEKNDFANPDTAWKEEVDAFREICKINGIDAIVERSRSGSGAHIWIFFQKPVEASLARKFGNALLQKGEESGWIASECP